MSASEKSVNNVVAQPKKQRSPSFPIIPIDEAINRVRLIYERDRRAFTTANAVLEHLGYSSKKGMSGTSGRVVAALKQYGLLDEKGGQYRVSDLAFRLLNLPDDSQERAELIAKAALSPAIFQKLLTFYQGEVPSDAALRSQLVLHEKFNPDSIDQFIRVFRRTIDIANPSPDDYNTGEESEGAEQPTGGTPPMQQSPAKPNATQSSRPDLGDNYDFVALPGAAMQFTLYLSQTKRGTLSIPFEITKKEWELLKKQIQSSLDVAEATALVEDSAPSPPKKMSFEEAVEAAEEEG